MINNPSVRGRQITDCSTGPVIRFLVILEFGCPFWECLESSFPAKCGSIRTGCPPARERISGFPGPSSGGGFGKGLERLDPDDRNEIQVLNQPLVILSPTVPC